MKTIFAPSVLLLFMAALVSSCNPVMYSTVGQNVPMFTEKGEVALSAAYGLSSSDEDNADAKGLAIQAATSISESSAIMASYYHLKGTENQGYPFSAPSEFSSSGNYLEAAFGKYGTFSESFAYEVFGGIGYGSITNDYQGTSIDVQMIKPFLQPSIGYISRYVDLILTPRIGFINYTSHQPGNITMLNDFIDENNNAVVFEPGITIRAGYQSVKLQIQYNYSTFSAKSVYEIDNVITTFNPMNQHFISLGIYVLISHRYPKE